MPGLDIDRWIAGWRGPLLAALVALLAVLPGLITTPPLDRDESRFAQATAQMLETRDFVNIQFQDQPRHKKPVGIHWLQAASVSTFSSPEARKIQAYRIPSLIGAMVAAAACAWGAAAFFGQRGGVLAGVALGSTFLLSTEGAFATTDGVLCGCVTLAMAALGRLYAASRGIGAEGFKTRLLFWAALALSVLVKGPIGPLVVGLTLITLAVWDRDAAWIRKLGWVWGLVLVVAVCGPWAVAITVATDGAFWGHAIGGDLAPKLAGGQESHGAPPGYYLLTLLLTLVPVTLMLPAAAVAGWTRRDEPGVRFAVAWLIPSWIVFELAPTKLPHYVLPLFGAIAWLVAAALSQPVSRRNRWIGVAFAVLGGVLVSLGAMYLLARYGDPSDVVWVSLAVGLAFVGALVSSFFLLSRAAATALLIACAFGVLAHASLFGGLAPNLKPLWPSRNMAKALRVADMDPRNGVTPGPVATAGFAEPSAVFLLGTETVLGDADDAADAIAEGRPAVVEARKDTAFQAALRSRNLRARPVNVIKGFNYSNGKPVTLTLYARAEVPRP